MATPTTVNPGTANFNDLVASHNNNALAVPTAGAIQPGAVVDFTAVDASPLFSVQLPYFPNFVVSGLVVSVAGAGPYTADYTAGSYQYDQQLWNVLAGAQPIGAAHPTLNRIDTLVGDNTGTVSLVAGTAAANPVRPALANVLILGDVYVPSAASGLPPVLATPAFINTPANDGDAIVYNAAAQTYLPTSEINTKASSTTVTCSTGSTLLTSTAGNVTVRTSFAGATARVENTGAGGNVVIESSTSGDVEVLTTNGDILIDAAGAGKNVVISAANQIELQSDTYIRDVNVVLGTATGTQIGTGATQKLAFFGATPKVQGAALTPQVSTLVQAGFTVEDLNIQPLTSAGSAFGFANKNEGETVIRAVVNLQTRFAELEARLNATTGNGLIA